MDETRRPDLAAMLFPLGRALIGIEEPILAENGLSMWAYAVLVGLGDEPVRTQIALAEAIGADKSRVIPVLDDLQERGLITRRRDPSDRRRLLVAITPQGRRLRDRTQVSVQRAEDQLLDQLSPADRLTFLQALRALSVSVQPPDADSAAPAPGQPPHGE